MTLWFGATLGAVVTLQCPACGLVQLRARRPRAERFDCKRCGHRLQTESPTAADARERSADRKPR